MAKNRGIALKLIVLILASITIIFSVVLSYNYFFSRQIITQNVEKNAENLSLATVNRIDAVLLAVEKVPKNLANFLESFSCEGGDITKLISAVVENNPEIYGATIAFEPYAYSANSHAFAPYFYKKDGKLEFTYIPYEYFTWDWYQIPKETNSPAWSEPYYDEGAGGIIMATFSVPFYKNVLGKKEIMGVVTADVSLSWLHEIITSIKIGETGYGFLLSRNGTFVTHPVSSLIMNETIFSVAEAREDTQMRELGRKMIRGESGFAPFTSILTGKKCWMKYAPLSSSGWSLAVLFPQDELMADITRLTHIVLSLSLVGFLLILVVIVWIAESITRPLRILSRAAEHIATGNLDIELPLIKTRDEVGTLADSFNFMKSSLKQIIAELKETIKAQDEVGTLADSFNFMKSSLKQYIAELKETTAAKERIESELKIAHDIQMGFLPKTFPPFPDRREFDIYATLAPAKEVGGDLYDFFFLDDEHLCFAIGDVSGKGVPAALFMAITKTLVKTKATQGLTTERVLCRVNEDLSLENEAMMFVTLFVGILNTRTGEVEYSNGGHNFPYILRKNGTLEVLEGTGGMALGIVDVFSYQSRNISLQRGDTLFLYTDGVTEATDKNEALFSEGRLEHELNSLHEKPVKEVITAVMQKVEAFSEGVPQADDITMLVLRYNGT